MAPRLRVAGYRVRCFSYSSVAANLALNAERLARFAESIDAPAVHFIGHSLGGLVVAQSLMRHPPFRPGRVILMGSPFADSHVVRSLVANRLGRALLGRCLPAWLDSRPVAWPAAHELGVIAGSVGLGMGRLLAPGLAVPNDGAVAVRETIVPGAADHIVLSVSHSAMLVSGRVMDQVLHFLGYGRFRRDQWPDAIRPV